MNVAAVVRPDAKHNIYIYVYTCVSEWVSDWECVCVCACVCVCVLTLYIYIYIYIWIQLPSCVRTPNITTSESVLSLLALLVQQYRYWRCAAHQLRFRACSARAPRTCAASYQVELAPYALCLMPYVWCFMPYDWCSRGAVRPPIRSSLRLMSYVLCLMPYAWSSCWSRRAGWPLHETFLRKKK